jgi:DNA adenine methylase
MKPFIKWAGGKARLAPEIIKHFPPTFGRYHEPFLGGGAVFFALRPAKAILSDINADLVTTYCAIRDNPEEVIAELQKYKATKEEYNQVRAQDPFKLSAVMSAARFIYLNKTCYNGLYRVNQKGQFNVPFGKRKNINFDYYNIMEVSCALQGVHIIHEYYTLTRITAVAGDLVYFDPPYDPVAKGSFTNYTKLGFDREQHTWLANLFAELANRGVHVVLSNSDTPFIRELYQGFKITEVKASRSIGGKGASREKVGELIITGERI